MVINGTGISAAAMYQITSRIDCRIVYVMPKNYFCTTSVKGNNIAHSLGARVVLNFGTS
jgi:hypothetical protein